MQFLARPLLARPIARRLTSAFLLAILLGAAPLAARADDYDSKRSGHPLRIAAYVLYPVGLLVDTLIFRPAHWVGSHEPFRTVFGHEVD
ncbi:MAG: hypothetical protein R3E88_18810 [Myxococcota bacterium]|nr:hypothetical protein [Myxococcales bacterium]